MTATVLFVPGLRDHVAEHWQTLMAARLPGSRTVEPLEHDKLSCAARIAALDAAIKAIDGPVLLVAHSAGCLMVVHWAKAHSADIVGALLATPADIERPFPAGYPTPDQLEENGWLPIPRQPLPFKTMVVASLDDPLGDYDRVCDMAKAWGAELSDAGAVGHLNPASGFGPWDAAEEHLLALCLDLPLAVSSVAEV